MKTKLSGALVDVTRLRCSAGRDVRATEPEVREDAIYQGWLKKRAIGKSTVGTLVKSWRTRYFVLLQDELRWYDRAEVDEKTGSSFIKRQHLGALPMSTETSLEPQRRVSKRAFAFTVVADGKRLVLQAVDEDQRDTWVAALRSCMGCPEALLATAAGEKPARLSQTLVEIVADDRHDVKLDEAEDSGVDERMLEEESIDIASRVLTSLATIGFAMPDVSSLPRWRGDSEACAPTFSN